MRHRANSSSLLWPSIRKTSICNLMVQSQLLYSVTVIKFCKVIYLRRLLLHFRVYFTGIVCMVISQQLSQIDATFCNGSDVIVMLNLVTSILSRIVLILACRVYSSIGIQKISNTGWLANSKRATVTLKTGITVNSSWCDVDFFIQTSINMIRRDVWHSSEDKNRMRYVVQNCVDFKNEMSCLCI